MSLDLKKAFTGDGSLDEKSLEFLTSAIQKANLAGFDYLEFKQSLTALQEMNMDLVTAFKSAFTTAATMGLTKDKLLKTADHYRKVLNTEKQQFDKALNKQLAQRVEAQKAEVEKLKQQVKKAQEQIAKLEKQIKKDQQTIDQADAKIQESKNKIEATQESFENTYQNLLEQIAKDIENIEKFL